MKLEHSTVLKATVASVLTLAAAMAVSGCSGKPQEAAKSAATPTAPAAGQQEAADMRHPPAKPGAAVDVSGVAKAAGGKTIAELYADKDALANSTVTVRGKVVKANHGIMGKDWLHLRDGTGAEGSNELTVTTNSTPPAKVGDTVVATGTVGTNRDFSMGYKYPVMLENAEVKVEPPGSN